MRIRRLLWDLDHISASNLARLHQIINLWELLEVDSLEGRLDLPASVEFNRLCAILPIAHVAALDANHPCHRLENGSLNLAAGWKANDDDAAARSHVLGSLLEGLLTGGNEDGGMRS
jgi:uncharacterized protein (DUF736 family)